MQQEDIKLILRLNEKGEVVQTLDITAAFVQALCWDELTTLRRFKLHVFQEFILPYVTDDSIHVFFFLNVVKSEVMVFVRSI